MFFSTAVSLGVDLNAGSGMLSTVLLQDDINNTWVLPFSLYTISSGRAVSDIRLTIEQFGFKTVLLINIRALVILQTGPLTTAGAVVFMFVFSWSGKLKTLGQQRNNFNMRGCLCFLQTAVFISFIHHHPCPILTKEFFHP